MKVLVSDNWLNGNIEYIFNCLEFGPPESIETLIQKNFMEKDHAYIHEAYKLMLPYGLGPLMVSELTLWKASCQGQDKTKINLIL